MPSHSTRRRFALLALVVGLAAASAAAEDVRRWEISPNKLRARVASVCVWPLESAFELAAQRRARVEDALAFALEHSGYRVIAARSLADALAAAERSGGGVFDALDGTRDAERARRALAEVRAQPSLHCDADLRGRFTLVRADILSDGAQWDGAKEWVALEPSFSSTISGWMTAISIELELRDRAGALLLRSARGIHATAKFDASANALDVPASAWLADTRQASMAAAIALDRAIVPGSGDVTLECLKRAFTNARLRRGSAPKVATPSAVRRWATVEDEGVRANAGCLVDAMPAPAATEAGAAH
jgi:hypothetical protein